MKIIQNANQLQRSILSSIAHGLFYSIAKPGTSHCLATHDTSHDCSLGGDQPGSSDAWTSTWAACQTEKAAGRAATNQFPLVGLAAVHGPTPTPSPRWSPPDHRNRWLILRQGRVPTQASGGTRHLPLATTSAVFPSTPPVVSIDACLRACCLTILACHRPVKL